MIRQITPLCALLFTLMLPELVTAGTAAETDWQLNETSGQCRGQYVEPASTVIDDESDVVDASAESVLHVAEHSTTLKGKVEMHRGELSLRGEFATIDAATETYHLDGSASLRQPGLLIEGDTITGSLHGGNAAVDSASFLLHQNRLRGSAKRIEKTAEGYLTIKSGEFTTCEPDSNAWSLHGSDITLFQGKGYGVARDVTVRIKDAPIAYLPYLRFPIDDSRQSGFLWPSLGQDSDGGTDIAAPYYFNLSANLDATYTLRSQWKRGVIHEGELRYLNPYGQNLLAAAYLPSDDEYDDRKLIDITAGNDFDKQDRWLAHVRHKGARGPWSSRINYTSVSDIDYLDDLGGFTNTDSDFDNTLGSNNSPALLRTGSLAYATASWRSILELRSFQELNQVQTPQYELLPRLSVIGTHVFGHVHTSALFQASAFDKPSSLDPEGTRVVGDLKASLPFRNSWGYVTPGLRLVHRSYSLDNTAAGERDNASITTGLATLDMGLVLEKHTALGDSDFRQTLEPRLFYLYAQEEFQDDLPVFDSIILTPGFDSMFRDNRYTGYDRIGDANQFALGITSRLLSTRTGAQVFAASIGQIFYLDERLVNANDFRGNDPDDDSSPVFIAMEGQFSELRVRASYEHDTEQSRSNRASVALKYTAANDAIFNFSYSMTDKSQQRAVRSRPAEESDISFSWPLGTTGIWNLVGRWNYGWGDGQTIESLVGLEYNDCCWKTRIVFRRNLEEPRTTAFTTPGFPTRFIQDRRADSGIYFEFQLKGLASLGGRLDNLLHNSIPGYKPGR